MASLERKDGQDKVLSRNSTGSWFRTLSAILGKAYEWEIIDENPCKRVKSPTNTQPDVEALQLSEVQTICDKLPEYDDIPLSEVSVLSTEDPSISFSSGFEEDPLRLLRRHDLILNRLLT